MRVVFLGPPASGKGTQACFFSKKLSIPCISTGDLLRSAKIDGSLSRSLIEKMDSGFLLPDHIVFDVLKKYLNSEHCQSGFLIDGFPRTMNQAVLLDELLVHLSIQLDCVVCFSLDRASLLERCRLRRTNLNARPDDELSVFLSRLDVYNSTKDDLISFYERKKVLCNLNAEGSINEVSQKITSLLYGFIL